MSRKPCRICLSEFERSKVRRSDKAETCQHPAAGPGPDCWFEKDVLHQHIAKSLLRRRPVKQSEAEARDRMFRDIQEAASVGQQLARQYLHRLSDQERGQLLKWSAPSMRTWLLNVYRDEELTAQQELKPGRYPELPEGLHQRLELFESRERKRLETRIKRGHKRSSDTLRRMMVEPIAFAEFLATRGVDRWELVTMRDRIEFAKLRPIRHQQRLKTFIEYLEGVANFKNNRGRPPKSTRKILREARQIPLLMPDELAHRLRDARERLPSDQYLLYWLVAKVGLTAKAASSLTLDRVTVNAKGRVVICPAEAWFALPKTIAPTMRRLAQEADSRWPHDKPEKAPAIPITADIIPQHRMGPEVFRGETTLLRSSAIYAAMRLGNLDRKTLVATTGVSLKTVSDLEFLVPADVHSLMSHKRVAARNRQILGKGNDS